MNAGMEVYWLMLKQHGIVIVAVYVPWVDAQPTVIIMVSIILSFKWNAPAKWKWLLGALASPYYMIRPQYVGLCAISVLSWRYLFQKASLLGHP